MIDNSLIL